MSGLVFHLDLESSEAQKALHQLSNADLERLTSALSTLIEDQTKQRITKEKAAPDGTPWQPWSDRYAEAIRNPNGRTGRSLLVGHPNLLPAIQGHSSGTEARVGVFVPYGAIHQFGGASVGKPNLPARPYLGLSDTNREALEALVIGEIKNLLT